MKLIGALRRTFAPHKDWCEHAGPDTYRVTKRITWQIGGKHSTWTHWVNVGYEFESSVPWFFRWVLPPDHPYFLFAAAVHDSLIDAGYTRPLCDGEWLSAARFSHAPKYLREFGFLVIRVKQLYRGLINDEYTGRTENAGPSGLL